MTRKPRKKEREGDFCPRMTLMVANRERGFLSTNDTNGHEWGKGKKYLLVLIREIRGQKKF